MDLKDIKAIIDLMKKNSISEFELEREEFKIKLKRGGGTLPVPDEGQTPLLATPIGGGTSIAMMAASGGGGSSLAPVPDGDSEITSPMVGTFYRAPSPESANYVEVGSEVEPDTVVCIIEAMKVMNEIKAEVRGVVTQILVENAKPVEFGQPMFKIRPS